MRPLTAATACLLALAGCSRSPPPAPAAPPPQPGPSGPVAEVPAPTPKGPTAYVNAVTALRREPTDAAKVPGKPGGKDVSNTLAILHRGEKVGVLETREEWDRVRTSDDSEGWMKRSSLLEGEGVTEATVLSATDVFDRPDLLAANARRKIEPGTLVLVVKARPPFSEVNVSGAQDAWVLTERLESSAKEVSVAKLCEKARYLVRGNRKDEALQLLALARQHFEGAALVATLAAELGEAPAEGGAAAPAAPGQAAPQPAAQ
jgi:SH3-like domain-containing protein